MKTNSKYELVARIARRGLLLAAFLGVALVCGTGSRAQSSAMSPTGPEAKPAAVASAALAPTLGTTATSLVGQSPSKGPHENIAIHGYWTIDVRNPDGKVAKHLEFENQLCPAIPGSPVPAGDATLSSLLSGNAVAGGWSIVLGEPGQPAVSANPGPCNNLSYQFILSQSGLQNGAVALNNIIETPNSPPALPPIHMSEVAPLPFTCGGSLGSEPLCFPALTVSTAWAPGIPSGITLSGQFTVPSYVSSALISAVGTDLFSCLPGGLYPTSISSFDCQNLGNYLAKLPGCSASFFSDYLPPGSNLPYLLTRGTPVYSEFLNCIPSNPNKNSIFVQSSPIENSNGRSPFSGVVLGTGGVPGPFTVFAGQTVAVTWTLSFQ
jgi:hypothetical protein